MSKGTITDKQREILEYIKSQILERGFPPAVREICEAVNLKSTSSYILIWRHWRETGISTEILRSQERLRFWTMNLIFSEERLSMSL